MGTMHLLRGTPGLNTKKRKVKITKAKYKELELQWREYNRRMKSKGMHELRYDTLEDYINYSYGRVKLEQTFKPYKPETSWRRDDHRERYPSAPLTPSDGRGTAKETLKYTGDLIVGIATMHKSNAVPVMKGTSQAEDIAKMRRN